MTSVELENLASAGRRKREPPDAAEIAGLLKSARARLADAKNSSLSLESRFDLAYNAAHAISLAALRSHGYRTSYRVMVFQLLPHTLGMKTAHWRILDKCHQQRNLAEYAGLLEVDEQLVAELVSTTEIVLQKAEMLGVPDSD